MEQNNGEERARHTPVSPRPILGIIFFHSHFLGYSFVGVGRRELKHSTLVLEFAPKIHTPKMFLKERGVKWTEISLMYMRRRFQFRARLTLRRLANELNPLLMISGREPSGAIFVDGKAQREAAANWGAKSIPHIAVVHCGKVFLSLFYLSLQEERSCKILTFRVVHAYGIKKCAIKA